MQPSSPSTAHSIQVPIKVQHRIAKSKKKNRRRRIDLNCGCSIFVGLDCANYGFTHRDTHHCSSGTEWRVYLEGSKSPLFQDYEARSTIIQQGPRRNNNTDTVQPQPQIPAGFAQVFPHFQDLEPLTSSDMAFLEGL
ncbi:transcriptional transactivator protein [Eupatorium yellow vein virus-[Suya]]|uniref:Transcriptional activator protein n=1 Tax=Eupatorium yellow vein virus-[Suya] TaxID=436246 RepID=B1B3G4_9GEMI|nr:transcriptional transactivator protein [Eupatorium yellow vein virus-[Suya]]BAG12166.1 transcriptional transactivator protein [Eupatorium yellow vein virus-[Suya]]